MFFICHSNEMNFIEIAILSFVEGFTEFLPVSSTAHLIITEKLMGFQQTEFSKAFDVIIQFGAIAAVLVIYSENFRMGLDFYKKLLVGFIPTAIIGFILKNRVSAWSENIILICLALIIGGILMIASDYYFSRKAEQTSNVDYKKSFFIGLSQCFALIPGVSRSAATIISGQCTGLNKKTAAEFSFFLAVPTLTAAALYKTWKIKDSLNSDNALALGLGLILSFIFAMLAIKFFIQIVQKYGFFWFGVYRILAGLVLLFIFRN